MRATTFAGNYPIEHRRGEIERLHIQAEAVATDTRVMLDRIGVQPGWRCLDIGCGPRGITTCCSQRRRARRDLCWVSTRTGNSWPTRGLMRPPMSNFSRATAYSSGLPAASFDLVHMRFVASTAGNPEALLQEAMRLVRPGGVVALQEPDVETFKCHPPHPAWGRLITAMLAVFASVDFDIYLARRLYSLFLQAGLIGVQYRPFLFGIRSTDPMADHLPATVDSIGAAIRPAQSAQRSRTGGSARTVSPSPPRSRHGDHLVHGRAGRVIAAVAMDGR